MAWLSLTTALLSLSVGAFCLTFLPSPRSLFGGTIFAVFAAYAWWTGKKQLSNPVIVRLKGLVWTREDFCRGWLITGDTGSGKTRSGINQLLFQVFTNDPNWGGLCIDDKGVYWETLAQMAKNFNRQNDLILLQVKPDHPPEGWKPRHTFNLTSDPSIPPMTYAKCIIDTASRVGQKGEQTFFKTQALTHMAMGLELLGRLGMDVTLQNLHQLLLNDEDLNEAIKELETEYPTERGKQLVTHFIHRYRDQPPEQMGGVKETIANNLQYFLTPDIAEVFCAGENTFGLHEMDRGKIICVAMPQKYQTERRYVNTFLKMLFYTHVLRRFDKPRQERNDDNLLVLWADEAQRFVTASEDGMSD